jgi:lipopolysaccharide transport system permease protein
MLSSLTVVYRDFRFAIPFLTQIGLYVTPVVYPLNLVHEKLGM